VSNWVEHSGLQAKLEGVISETVAPEQFFKGRNSGQEVDHEEQLYQPVDCAIYWPVNQAAGLLELPLMYTTTRGTLNNGNVIDHVVTDNVSSNILTSALISWPQFSHSCVVSILNRQLLGATGKNAMTKADLRAFHPDTQETHIPHEVKAPWAEAHEGQHFADLLGDAHTRRKVARPAAQILSYMVSHGRHGRMYPECRHVAQHVCNAHQYSL